MNWTRFVGAAASALILQMAVGTVWHVMLFKTLYQDAMTQVARPVPNTHAVLLAVVVRALLLAWIYPLGYSGGTRWREGLRFGVVMGLLSGTIIAILYGNANFGAAWLWADLAYFLVEGALVGIVIAYCYGKNLAAKR
jgi:hypothetical protein